MREHQLRRCIVCKRSAAQEELLRFVPSDTGIAWDRDRKLPGRGAYIHRALACWGKMLERNRWEHAFRGTVKVSGENLLGLQQAVREEIPELGMPEESKRKNASGRKVRL